MEIIVDCPKCGSSELETRSDWTQEDDIYVYVGECVGCQILTRAELIPHGPSLKLFVQEIASPKNSLINVWVDCSLSSCLHNTGHGRCAAERITLVDGVCDNTPN